MGVLTSGVGTVGTSLRSGISSGGGGGAKVSLQGRKHEVQKARGIVETQTLPGGTQPKNTKKKTISDSCSHDPHGPHLDITDPLRSLADDFDRRLWKIDPIAGLHPAWVLL